MNDIYFDIAAFYNFDKFLLPFQGMQSFLSIGHTQYS